MVIITIIVNTGILSFSLFLSLLNVIFILTIKLFTLLKIIIILIVVTLGACIIIKISELR